MGQAASKSNTVCYLPDGIADFGSVGGKLVISAQAEISLAAVIITGALAWYTGRRLNHAMNSNLTTHLRQAAHGVSAVGLFMSIGTQIFALSNHALPFLVWMILDREVYLPLIKPEQLKLGFGQWTAITLVSTTVGMAFAHVVDLAGKFHRWVGHEEEPETGGEDWDLE